MSMEPSRSPEDVRNEIRDRTRAHLANCRYELDQVMLWAVTDTRLAGDPLAHIGATQKALDELAAYLDQAETNSASVGGSKRSWT